MVKKVEHNGRKMWKYGDAGDRWPVSDRDVWACGPHRLVCGDIHDGAFETVVERHSPDLVYTDPPWSLSNEKAFRTKAGLDNSDASFESLISQIAAQATAAKGLFVETSTDSEDKVREILKSAYEISVQSWDITYYGENPCRLLYVGGGSPPDFTGLDDEETPKRAIEGVLSHPSVVADPCTGYEGLTARAAEKFGHQFVGVELHPRRLARVLEWFAEQGYEPERVCEDYSAW